MIDPAGQSAVDLAWLMDVGLQVGNRPPFHREPRGKRIRTNFVEGGWAPVVSRVPVLILRLTLRLTLAVLALLGVALIVKS
ncbi:hypothetical protein LRS13_06570 [Svornostia abyssi]|uniref:Uncharacterized protein n=1 Tax=Svornostia abyssi TaxID=2898438 RepID=A0ABY5PKN9_9ACTN|nr:hypothetical protein LRS13_06570 [Parviterribacteraceae bacterium J379]